MSELICETVPAKERATILGREIATAIRKKTFEFQRGCGWYFEGDKDGKVVGCAVGAAMHVLGGRPESDTIYRGLESIGFMTSEEIEALENGYEDLPESHETVVPVEPDLKAFYRLGQRLRARPDSAPIMGKAVTKK